MKHHIYYPAVLLIMVVNAIMVGCTVKMPPANPPTKDVYRKTGDGYLKIIEIIEIDGCEYLMYSGDMGRGNLIHKQNCKFCTERATTKPKE